MKEEEIRNICTAAAGLYGIIHVRQLSEVLAYVGETNHTRRRLLGREFDSYKIEKHRKAA